MIVKPAPVYAIWMTAALLPLVYMVVWHVLAEPYSVEIKSMVIGAVVGSVLQAIVQFWLGSSASSQRKDEKKEGDA